MTRRVGRDAELDELRQLLAGDRAAVVIGPPGIGKSLLAAQLGEAPWVDLAGVTGTDALVSALARALDAPAERPEAIIDAARGHVHLVLDAADGLGDALGAWLEPLRAVTRLLITSRHRLPLDIPQLELGPLPPEEGAELLRQRLRSVARGRDLAPGELRRLAEAVDGVPLALVLIAPRLRLHTVDDLLARPTEGLDPLLDAVREAVAAGSPTEREVLRFAAVLPCPFDAELLGVVCGRPVDGELLALLDASLVHPMPGLAPRFRLLGPIRAALAVDDALRAQGIERLAQQVLPVAEAHVDRLETADFAGPARALAHDVPLMELLLDHPSAEVRLRAALVLAGREARTGPLTATLARDRRLGPEGPAGLQVAWAAAVATAASHFGRHEEALAALDRVADLAEGDDAAIRRAQRAVVLVYAGQTEDGLREADALAEVDHPIVQLRVGIARFYGGDLASAEAPLRRARDTAPTAYRKAQAAVALAAVLRDRGEPPDRVAAELSLGASERIVAGLPWIAPRAAFVRGVAAADRGDLALARAEFAASADGMRALGEAGQAVSVDAVRLSLDLVDRDEVPLTEPPGDLSLHEQATWGAWHAVFLAARGEQHGALAVGEPCLAALAGFGDRNAPELAALLAVAVGPGFPELTEGLLRAYPDTHPMVALARDLLAGAEARVGARMEHRVLAALARRHPSRVRVDPDGSCFVGPDGQVVDIRGRKVLRKVLAALAAATGPLDVDALCREVWPGERLVGESGTRRVHVAISTLRGLGLRAVLHTVTLPDGSTGWELAASRSL